MGIASLVGADLANTSFISLLIVSLVRVRPRGDLEWEFFRFPIQRKIVSVNNHAARTLQY